MKSLNPRKAFSMQIVVALFLALGVPRLGQADSSGSQSAVPPEARQKLAKVQIPFLANQGQGDKEVKFTARTFAGTVFVTETGELVYSLPKLEGEKRVKDVVLKEELIGGKVTEVKGESQAVTRVSYFRGNDRSKWQSNIPTYDTVSLGEVYEEIDFKLKAYGNNVEKLFYVKPGAEPETIKIKLSGGNGIKVNENGELQIEMEQGTVRFSKPVAFQEDGAKKEFVKVAYAVRGSEYGFNVGDYDRTRELVIDPILTATFVGGGGVGGFGSEGASALAVDNMGNVYVAGFTSSEDFPGIGPGSADSTIEEPERGQPAEGFVAKLNSDLSSILAATFVGGGLGERSGEDGANALALDSMGNVYVAGFTGSADFPGVGPGSADNTCCGAFVAKLNSDLSSILAATFLDGGAAAALALDSGGNVYVVTGGFVAKLNSDLSSILAATFLDGGAARALALDSTGNVYLAGNTASSDFPSIGPGSADSTFAGDSEGFVAKLNSDLSSILAATFLGGSDGDFPFDLALDNIGNVYVAGVTNSADFPGVGPGSADSTFAGDSEGFVAKLNSDLSSILAATFLGGSNFDGGSGSGFFLDFVRSTCALDNMGNIYVAGVTSSSDFPGVGPGSADSTVAPDQFGFVDEGFVVKLNSNLSSILAATFLGGSEGDFAGPIVLDSLGNVYVAGLTVSSDFPGVGPGSADSTIGEDEGFVAKLDANLSSGLQIINDNVNFVVQSTSFDPTSVSGGLAGTFTVIAVLTNTSTENIHEPINATVKTLSTGNRLLSATEGDGSVTSKQAIDAGSDDILSPNESATVEFRIGLETPNRFEFFVDVLGPVQ